MATPTIHWPGFWADANLLIHWSDTIIPAVGPLHILFYIIELSGHCRTICRLPFFHRSNVCWMGKLLSACEKIRHPEWIASNQSIQELTGSSIWCRIFLLNLYISVSRLALILRIFFSFTIQVSLDIFYVSVLINPDSFISILQLVVLLCLR